MDSGNSSSSKLNNFFKIRELTYQEIEELLQWLDKFELSRKSKKLAHDFSDGVLLAEILNHLYPKLVEIHNYTGCNSYKLKIENWFTLNRKVLRKINLALDKHTMDLLAKSEIGVIEPLLFEVMVRYSIDCQRKYEVSTENEEEEEDLENSDILMVNISQKIEDGTVNVSQKMIRYSLYEQLEEAIEEKNQEIAILTQKVEHLENLSKLKSQRIDDLTSLLSKKDRRMTVDCSDNFENIDLNSLLFDS